MALNLPDSKRLELWARFMRENRAPFEMGKRELRTVVNRLDGRVTGLLGAARPDAGTLTEEQLVHLLLLNLQARHG